MEPDDFDHPLPPRYVKGDEGNSVVVLILLLLFLTVIFLVK